MDKINKPEKKRSTNRITKKSSVKLEKKIREEKSKKIVEAEENVVDKKNESNVSSFNLIEVIIIMFITAVFGILIGSCATYFKSNVMDEDSNFEEFKDIYNELLSDSYNNVTEDDLIHAAIKGMLEKVGDPYSTYYDKDETEEFNEDLNGEFVGLGAYVSYSNNTITITELFKNGPAEKAGFKVGDIIVNVGGEDVTDKDLEYVTKLIKGEDGSKVDITVIRDKVKQVITLTRGKVEIASVKYQIKDNYGYISISIFAKNTPEQFERALTVLNNKKVKGYIIDLRGNGGGYATSAVEMVSLLTKKDTVVYKNKKNNKITDVKTTKGGKFLNKNVVVLINNGSASASEIFASSLNENINATLVGQKTYGKGLVQRTKKLKDGSMIKYTVEEWLTSKGRTVNKVGISPTFDVKLSNKYDGTLDKDDQYLKAKTILDQINS